MGRKKDDFILYDFNDKSNCTLKQIDYMLSRTRRMFKYENLPESIPERELELILQRNGSGIIAVGDDQGTLYALIGGFGGEPDAYYNPTKYVVANPHLKLNKTFTINEDAILITNDSLWMGLLPLMNRYATMLTENEISIRLSIINHRIISLLKAGDDNSKASAERYLKQIEEGKLGVIGDDVFIEDGVKTLPYATAGYNGLSSLIEVQQYLKASWFNELGLQSNYNMKRESINSVEGQLDTDALLPLCDDMLECRKEFCEKVNDMFGTSISVDFSSSWKLRREEMEKAVEESETPAEDQEEEPAENDEEGGSEDENENNT